MRRCIETALAVADEVDVPVSAWLDLREVLGRRTFIRRQKDSSTHDGRAVVTGDAHEEGWWHGDSDYESMTVRAASVVDRVRSDHDGGVIAMVTHGGFGSYVLAAALGAGNTWFQLDNGSLTTLRWPTNPASERAGWQMYPPVGLEVLALNDLEHVERSERSA
jgi:broad specificity phosphatase PhoE